MRDWDPSATPPCHPTTKQKTLIHHSLDKATKILHTNHKQIGQKRIPLPQPPGGGKEAKQGTIDKDGKFSCGNAPLYPTNPYVPKAIF